MNKVSTPLPRFLALWVRWVVPPFQRDTAPQEWEEIYSERLYERGSINALFWVLGQGFLTLKDIYWDRWKGGWTMLTSWSVRLTRPYRKKGLYPWINTLGLAVGLAAAGLIIRYVQGEMRYESMHPQRDRIYRVTERFAFDRGQVSRYAMIPDLIGPALPAYLPEVVRSVRYRPGGSVVLRSEGQEHRQWRPAVADPGFFEMFGFQVIQGDDASALSSPDGMVINRKLAEALFGSVEVLGRAIEVAGEGVFHVAGVMENAPAETHLQFDFLVPFQEGRRMGVPAQQFLFYETLIELRPHVDLEAFAQKIRPLFDVIAPGAPADVTMHIQALCDIHLHSDFDIDIAGHGSAEQVRLLLLVAALILLIAGINFVNLSTARAARRAREVGLRKTLGGTRYALFIQFMGEAAFNVILASMLALLLAALALPGIQSLTGKAWQISDLLDGAMVLPMMAVLLMMVLGAGGYPALVLSAYTPMQVLRQGRLAGGQGRGLRWALVVVQFALTAGLWVMTWIARDQGAYLMGRSSGYDREAIVTLALDEEALDRCQTLVQKFSALAGVEGVSRLSESPVNVARATDYLDWPGKSPEAVHLFSLLFCDANAADVLGLSMAEGRFFSDARPADGEGYVINEAAAKVLGLDDPIGQRFSMWEQPGRILGVVQDFHFQPLYQSIQPLILKLNRQRTEVLAVRLAPGQSIPAVERMAKTWRALLPSVPFQPRFLQAEFQRLHETDQRYRLIFSVFSTLALGVSCLGLLGLAAYMAEQRTREMGIRRMLGASGRHILWSMGREFVAGLVLANGIAVPLAWWIGSNWLQRFAYRIDIGVAPFLQALLLSLGVALGVIVGQAVKMVRIDPAKTLRQE